MKVTVHGTGYVGLITGACLAQAGNDVLCVDPNQDKVTHFQAGEIDIPEPGLKSLVRHNLDAGRLRFSTSTVQGVEHGLYQYLCMGISYNDEGETDMSNFSVVVSEIAQHMDGYKLFINRSASPVGSTENTAQIIQGTLNTRQCALDFDVVYNPEFLKEGVAIDDFNKPDRIIIGSHNDSASELMRDLYQPFNRDRNRIILMGIRAAELTKYASSALLATKISFMNELAMVAEQMQVDIEQVRHGIGSDPRIGYHYIYPGCGYGGARFSNQILALQHSAHKHDTDTPLLSAVIDINEQQKLRPVEKLKTHFKHALAGKVIALWGLSFKPNTTQVRSATSVTVTDALLEAGASIRAYDPSAMEKYRALYPEQTSVVLCDSASKATEGADALLVLTEWAEFRSPDFTQLKNNLRHPVLVDGRNIYHPAQMSQIGFHYYAIGRGD